MSSSSSPSSSSPHRTTKSASLSWSRHTKTRRANTNGKVIFFVLTFSHHRAKIEKRLSILFFVLDYINTRFVKPELNVHAKEQQTSLSLSRLLLVKEIAREWRKKTRETCDPLVRTRPVVRESSSFSSFNGCSHFFFCSLLGSPLSWDSRHFSVLLDGRYDGEVHKEAMKERKSSSCGTSTKATNPSSSSSSSRGETEAAGVGGVFSVIVSCVNERENDANASRPLVDF